MKKILLITLFLFLALRGIVFAQETVPAPQTGAVQTIQFPSEIVITSQSPSQEDIFRAYQATNDSVQTFIFLLALIATIFGVFIASFGIFFGLKQLNADREIQKYKESIKKQELKIEKETARRMRELLALPRYIRRKKSMIDIAEKKLTMKSKTAKTAQEKSDIQKKLHQLEKEVENITKMADYQRGRLSATSPVLYASASDIISPDSAVLDIGAQEVQGISSGVNLACPYCQEIHTTGICPQYKEFLKSSGAYIISPEITEDSSEDERKKKN